MKGPITGDVKIRRSVPGLSVMNYLDVTCSEFAAKLLDTRENADNNDYIYPSLTKLRLGSAGIFSNDNTSSVFFAVVKRCEKFAPKSYTYYLQKYQMLPFNLSVSQSHFDGYQSRFFPVFLTDQENHIVLAPHGNELFEMSPAYKYITNLYKDNYSSTGSGHRLLNVHKFGSL